MIDVAEDNTLWFSLDPDDATYEEPLTGVPLQFWCEDDECSYVGYINEDDELYLFNVEDEKEVSDWADIDLDE